MTRAVTLLFVLVAAGLYVASVPTPLATPADLVLINARIYTVERGRPRADAVAIRDGRLIAVGDNDDVLAYRGASTTVSDAGGRAVVPGLHDAHGHFQGLGQSLQQLNLRQARSAEELAALVAGRVASLPTDAWLVGRGWHQNKWPGSAWPTAAILDAVAPAHPVFLTRVEGHAAAHRRPGRRGHASRESTNPPPDDTMVRAQIALAVEAGYQPAVHAIADRANRDALDVFERIQQDVPGSRALRMRNEHAQILHPDHIARFGELDVVAPTVVLTMVGGRVVHRDEL